MPLQDDAVLGQGAGLVGAQDVHRAEVLDRVEALHDDLLARHGDRALGEVHRHDHRQHFRRKADGHRHREEQRLQPVVLRQAVDQEDGRDHDQDEADHQPGEPVDALVEGGRNVPPGDLVGELAEECVGPGPKDHAGGVARYDVRAHEAEVRQVEGIVAVLVARVGVFLGGHGLARQGGLVDEQVLGFEQAQVRRDHVARGKPHDIARHELLHRDLGEWIVRGHWACA